MHPCTVAPRARLFPRVSAVIAVAVLIAPPGFAARGDITLLGQIKPFSTTGFTNVWGFERDGRAYAVIGDWDKGPIIIDVTDPTTPFVRKIITGSGVFGFDVKVWGDYIYTCEGRFGAPLGSSRAIDITNMDTPVISDAFINVHAFAVHPDGYLFAEIPGLRIYDLNADPTPSAYLWYDGDLTHGHDSTVDVEHNRLYDFHGYAGTKVYDISTIATPVLLKTITDPTITYHHSGDATENGQHLFLCDELAVGGSKDCTVWDIAATPPQKIGVGLHDPTATIHNLYIIGNFAFVSHYTAGFRVYDVSNPAAPVLLDTYDTAPALSGDGYSGCYGVYPFGPGGVVYASDDANGLFLFQVEDFSGAPTAIDDTPAISARLLESYPNPFNPTTTIAYELERPADVTLSIFDVRGGLVRTLARAHMPAGRHEVRWNGTRSDGARVTSGMYFARLTAGGVTDTGRLVLLK